VLLVVLYLNLTSLNMAAYVGRFSGTEKGNDLQSEQNPEAVMALQGSAGKSAAKWSLMSERVEGLAKELFVLTCGLDPYANSVSNAEGPIMEAIRKKMEGEDWDGLWERKESMFPYGPEASTDPLEAQFIKMMTFMKNPKRVLEVGMFAGYGAAAIIEALPDTGKLVSLDMDPFLKTWVTDVMSKFEEGAKHEIVVGPALESMKVLDAEEKFDLVFVDANKSEYKAYVETLLSRDLLAEDATMIIDNTLYCGMPFVPSAYDTQPKRRGYGDDIREFNEWVANHPQLMQAVLPIRDGVSIVRKRS